MFENVPMSANEDVPVTIRPAGNGAYSLSPFPFATDNLGIRLCRTAHRTPDLGKTEGGWPAALKRTPTEWESFRLVAA